MILEMIDVTRPKDDPERWASAHLPLPEGATLATVFNADDKLKAVAPRVISATLNGTPVGDWRTLSPRKQDKVVLTVLPGDGFFAIISIILTVISVVQFIVSLFTAPTAPSTKRKGQDPTYSFEGLRNEVTPGDPVNVLYGEHRHGGQLLGYAVDVVAPRRQELSMLIGLCEGPIEGIDHVEINDIRATLIQSLSIQTRLGLSSQSIIDGFDRIRNTFFDGRDFTTEFIRENENSPKVNSPGEPIIYSTVGNDVESVDIQVQFPDGIGENKADGHVKKIAVTYRVEYANQGQGNWILATDRKFEGKKRGAIFDNYPFTFPSPGAYDLRLTWLRAPGNLMRGVDMFRTVLFNITEYRGVMPPNSGTALLAIRACATSQLQGGQPRVTSLVQGKKVKVYSSGTSSAFNTAWTQNPAWCVRDYLTNSVYGGGTVGITDADIHQQSFYDFAVLANSQVEVCSTEAEFVECPDDATVYNASVPLPHSDQWDLDQNTRRGYYYIEQSLAIARVDLDPPAFILDTTTQSRWYATPGVGANDGTLFVTNPTSNLVYELDPVNLAPIRLSPNVIGGLNAGEMLVTDDRLYVIWAAALLNTISAINRSTLTGVWSFGTAPGSGLGNRIAGYCVDSNGNLWVTTWGASHSALNKILSDGSVTTYDVYSVFGANNVAPVADDTNGNIVLFGTVQQAIFNIGGASVSSISINGGGNDPPNRIIDGKYWSIAGGSWVSEFDARSGTVTRSIAWGQLSGGSTNANWQEQRWVPTIEGLHVMGLSDVSMIMMPCGEFDPGPEVGCGECTFFWEVQQDGADSSLFDVAWSPALGIFVAVCAGSGGIESSGNFIMTSSDGENWTIRTYTTGTLIGVTWSADLGIFVVVGPAGRVATSSNGTSWTNRTAAENNTWQKVTWASDLTLFAAVSSDGTNRVMTSPDGITWTARSAQAIPYNAVTWSPELTLFVAVAGSGGSGGRVSTSPDGITWTQQTTPTTSPSLSLQGVAWSPDLGLFAAARFSTSGSQNILTSPDGITWTLKTTQENFYLEAIIWIPELEMFLACSNYSGDDDDTNYAIYSCDGETWFASLVAGAQTWRSLAWSPSLAKFVFVGDPGSIGASVPNDECVMTGTCT